MKRLHGTGTRLNVDRIRLSLAAAVVLFGLASVGLAVEGTPKRGAADSGGAFALAAGDRVRVQVLALEIGPLELVIPPDGRIAIPSVGVFDAAGRGLTDIQDAIRKSIEDSGFVGSAGIAMHVVSYAPRNVYLLQGVRTPGAYPIPMGGGLRLSQALALAGGLADHVRRGDLKIHRPRPGGGLPTVIRFDLGDITDRDRIENDLRLLPGDTIVIPDESNPDGWVYIGGEVRKPGRYPLLLADQPTVLRSVLAAGGFTSQAEPGAIRLLRHGDEGTTTERVDLRAAVRDDATRDVPVRPGDVIIVPGGVF